MKRAAFLVVLLAVPAAVFAEGATRRMIVVTRHQAPEAMQRLRGNDFDQDNRVRYNARGFKYINAFAADLDESEIAALKKSPEVQWIEESHEVHTFAQDAITPGAQTTPFGIKLVNAPAVWPVTKGRSLDPTKPIRVAIIDTGIDYTSPELSGAFKGGKNVLENTDDPLDDDGHGSHVAGIIAAADNGEGVVGVAPQVEIYSVKALDSCGTGSNTSVLDAVEWVRSKKKEIGGNWIINLSIGSKSSSTVERLEYQGAADDGILTFAASGNDFSATSPNVIAFPAAYPSVNAVGAVDSQGQVAFFSQRGPALKVVAPGGPSDPNFADMSDFILSTFIDGQLTLPDGTKTLARFPDGFNLAGKSICLPRVTVTAPYVFCGTGRPDQIPASVAGKIALIARGGTDPNNSAGFFFKSKMLYAKAAGAIGVVVYNIPGRPLINPALTDLDEVKDVPGLLPFCLVSEDDGAKLKATSGTITVKYANDGFTSTFELLVGTSMACPHAVGVAALVWSLAPSATSAAIVDAMEKTARDLGDAGVDNTYGFGLVNALDAGKQVNPNAFIPAKPTGRHPGRRGH